MLKLFIPVLGLCFLPVVGGNYWFIIMVTFGWLSAVSMWAVNQPILGWVSWGSYVSVDGVGGPLISLSLWVCFLMVLASGNIYTSGNKPRSFCSVVSLLCVALLGSFSVSNMFSFYVAFESSLIPTLILILSWGYQPERLQAGFYFVIYTVAASLPLLIIIVSVGSLNGHLSFFFSGWEFPWFMVEFTGFWWVVMVGAFLVKLPLYGVHLWLPKAHVEAPVAGSMVLAGVLLKLGGYGLMRILSVFSPMPVFVGGMIMGVGLWGGFIAGLICLRQVDVKCLVAYSSVGHMGVMVAGLVNYSSWGWSGCVSMMVSHGLCSSALFALAAVAYEVSGSRSIFLVKGLSSMFPSFAFWWFVFSSANMAAPPFLGLYSEGLLIGSIISQGDGLGIIISLGVFITGAYCLYLYVATQHGPCPSFMNSGHMFSSRQYSVMVYHGVPLGILILKVGLVSGLSLL